MSFAVSWLSPSTASADEACGDTTCPKGFECKEERGGCPLIACLDANCEPCTPSVRYECHPTTCAEDSDCASGMACAEFEQTECSGSAPSCPGGGCDTAVTEECTTTTTKQCAPRWTLACTSAADCGAGFTCEPEISTGCSGSGPTGTRSDSAAPSSPAGTGGAAGSGSAGKMPEGEARAGASNTQPPECTSEPTGKNACKPIETVCASDDECASGFTCGDNPNNHCTLGPNGSTSCTDLPKLCLPPYYGFGRSGFARGVATEDGASLASAPRSTTGTGVTASGGGCALSTGESRGAVGGVVGLLGLVLGLGMRRRRRVAS